MPACPETLPLSGKSLAASSISTATAISLFQSSTSMMPAASNYTSSSVRKQAISRRLLTDADRFEFFFSPARMCEPDVLDEGHDTFVVHGSRNFQDLQVEPNGSPSAAISGAPSTLAVKSRCTTIVSRTHRPETDRRGDATD